MEDDEINHLRAENERLRAGYNVIMTDLEIAAAHLALQGTDTPSEARRFKDQWLERLPDMLSSEHFGDCTKVSGTCSRCVAEGALSAVELYRMLFLQVRKEDDR